MGALAGTRLGLREVEGIAVVPALVARTGVLFAVVTFCIAVSALAAWLAVERPGSELLSADTRSALAAGYGPDQHVFTQPPLDTTINQAAQNDARSSSQAPRADSLAPLSQLPRTPVPEAGTLPLGVPRETPKLAGTVGASSVTLARAVGVAPTPTVRPGVMADFAPTTTPFRTPLGGAVATPNDIPHDTKVDASPDVGGGTDGAGAKSAAASAHGPAANASDRAAHRPDLAHAPHSDAAPSARSVAVSTRRKDIGVGRDDR
jgi:hypothetical protein